MFSDKKRAEKPFHYCLFLVKKKKKFHPAHKKKIFMSKNAATKQKHVAEIPGLLNFSQWKETVWHPQGQDSRNNTVV